SSLPLFHYHVTAPQLEMTEGWFLHTNTHIHIHTHTHTQRERGREREKETERESASVCAERARDEEMAQTPPKHYTVMTHYNDINVQYSEAAQWSPWTWCSSKHVPWGPWDR